ncbi:MAG: hypothetical protein ACK4JB_17410 [Reyranella sp.]
MPDTIVRQGTVEMSEIEAVATDLATAKRALDAELQRADTKLAKVREECADRLKEAATTVAIKEAELLGLVRQAEPLFRRPQSVEFDGVKVGWRKGKGRLELPDVETLVKRIVDQLTPQQRKGVLKVKTTVRKGGLAKLSGEILKKLGVTLTAAGAEPFVSFPKSTTEKLVDWWLKPLPAATADEDE